MYKELDFISKALSFLTHENLNFVRVIMRTRMEMLPLNYKPWTLEMTANCSRYNLGQVEDTLHFTVLCQLLTSSKYSHYDENIFHAGNF